MPEKQNREDAELIGAYKDSGDLEILGELYSKYIHLVYGVCLKYFADRNDSKDAVSLIFESLIKEVPKYEIKDFKSWLYVVVKNHCLMEIRKRKTISKKHQQYSMNVIMESTEFLHPFDDDVPDNSVEEKLKECLERLKKEQKECVVQFYYQGKCYKEISDDIGIDITKVKSYIQNGKRNLRICIEKKS